MIRRCGLGESGKGSPTARGAEPHGHLKLKALGAKYIEIHDLTPYQNLVYRAVAPYWRPYLMVVKF